MRNVYYVYLHRRADSGIPFYIGKGLRGRAYSLRDRSEHWYNIVQKHGYTVEILQSSLDEQFAFDLETNYICCYGRKDLKEGVLVNQTDGGDGSSGYCFSTHSRRKMSESQKRLHANGYIHPSLGKRRSKATKKKMSDSQKKLYANGYISPTKGKIWSLLDRKRISDSLKQTYLEGYVAPMKGKNIQNKPKRKWWPQHETGIGRAVWEILY